MSIDLVFNTRYLEKIANSEEWRDSVPLAHDAKAAVDAMAKMGQLGFLYLDFLEDQIADAERVIRSLSFKIQFHLVIGIGGSSLGAKALLSALVQRETVRTFFLESTDPSCVVRALNALNPEQTLLTVISKSGNTLETLALFHTVVAFFQERLSDWKAHLLIVTDAEKGELRRFANEEGLTSLPIPESIGGRFSVLTAVGIVPALVAGIPVRELFHGTRNLKRSESPDWRDNPALALALTQYCLHKKTHRPITILMPYAERLRDFTDWAAQLWAESIGKRVATSGAEAREGFTTLKAMGSVDQHSQCQLYLEGPRDKWAVFVTVEKSADDRPVPAKAVPATGLLGEAWRWLSGKSLHGILGAQQAATAQALSEQDVPSLTIRLPELTPYTLGQLIFLFELQTAYMGALYGVNAFDQPGVERIKQLTFAILKGA